VKTTVIAASGSREHPKPELAVYAIADYVLNEAPGPVIVRHGDCPGPQSVDAAVAAWIDECGELLGVTADPMPADWDHCTDDCPRDPDHRRRKKPGDIWHPGVCDDYCPGAGPRRNDGMVRRGADAMYGWPAGASYGTRNCMRLARQAGIPVQEITP
jgi:hypothetical protein